MSRGLGKLQRVMFDILRRSGKPMTFSEMRGGKVEDPTFERSCRRALAMMVQHGVVMPLGKGGPGDPWRYCLDPMMVAITSDKAAFERAMDMVKADPGGNIAIAKATRAMADG